ncbi:MAG: hypothetical protein ACRDJN_17035, partial [Chloroflexota bacterium]
MCPGHSDHPDHPYTNRQPAAAQPLSHAPPRARKRTIGTIDARTALVLIAGFIIAISIHEFSHAFTAWSLGDRTA